MDRSLIALLIMLAIALPGLGGAFGALMSRASRVGERIAFAALALGSACGLVVSLRTVILGITERVVVPWSVPGGELSIRLDPIAAMFLVQVFTIAPLASLYGLEYWPQRHHPTNGRKLRLFFGLLVSSMAILISAGNDILFLFGWEGMALAAFFVVTTEDTDQAVRESGFVYLIASRIGTLSLFAMFVVLHHATGSWSFTIDRPIGSGAATAVFALGLFGCMLKAGAMPMHVWLPGAHANAPSHVSALMSGVVIKMGIYGIVRITSLFDHPPLAWGIALFVLGAVSGVLGVAFALGQHDIKRLLAYHSVENIGIILMGLALAVLGRATHQAELVALGLAGALLHVWNHGLFKALLFLSAGSVVHATHTREIDALGGLAKSMPKTALAFLTGAIAICGLPPFNGFVSELFIYLAMLHGMLSHALEALLVGSFGVPALALIGGLAVACFVKVFGAVFLGSARSEKARGAKEAGPLMTGPMLVLGVCCAFIGVAPLAISPIVRNATAVWAPDMAATAKIESFAPLGTLSFMSGLLLFVLVVVSLLSARRAKSSTSVTWDCGYAAPSARMQYTASSFAEMLVGLFAWALRPHVRSPEIKTLFPPTRHFHTEVPDTVLDRAVLPATRMTARALVWFRWIQSGSVQLYIVYVAITLVLAVLFFRR